MIPPIHTQTDSIGTYTEYGCQCGGDAHDEDHLSITNQGTPTVTIRTSRGTRGGPIVHLNPEQRRHLAALLLDGLS